jgi:hypothetical protein
MLVTSGTNALALAIPLTILPWVAAPRLDAKARVLYGFLWLAGLLMFALAVRSLVVWWLLMLPLTGMVLSEVRTPSIRVVRTAQRAILLVIFALIAAACLETWLDPALRAGTVASRYLPSTNAKAIEPLAKWLDCNTRHEAGGRLVTSFNYGGYVPWRLPYLSESIDGRVIFADSVGLAETYVVPTRRDFPLQPWRTADLAIFPVTFPVAAVLDTAHGWHRIAITSQIAGPATMIALWVQEKWWQRAGSAPLPHSTLPVMHSLDPRNATCSSLVVNPAGA